MKNYVFVVLLILVFVHCSAQKTNEDVIVVIQPKMEKARTNSIKILFKNLKRGDSIFISKTKVFELNDNPSIREIEINGQKYLGYYTYIIPKQIGIFSLPTIQGFTKNRVLKADPISIEVVDKMPNTTDKDIILRLVSDKKRYKEKDTINFALYEYSKYYEVNKITTKRDYLISLPKIKNKGNSIQIEKESDLYRLSGNENLEGQLEKDFKIIEGDYDPFRQGSVMEELKGSLYIKTLLISFKLLPKHKGRYTIASSEFIYLITKSDSDYFDLFTPNKDGTYHVNKPKNRIHIKSNELSFIVR